MRLLPPLDKKSYAGFSLVELAVVLIIVALLTSGLFLGISAQRNVAENSDAQQQLNNIREALLGYAMANGRLPCPAQANLPSNDVTNAGRALPPPCEDDLRFGVIPWQTLGLKETDPWGNRFTYFVSSKFSGVVAAGAQSSFTLTTGSPEATPPDNAGTANIKESTLSVGNVASDIPVVVISHGANGAGAWKTTGVQDANATGDEFQNTRKIQTFYARTQGQGFDDLVTWISASTLKAKMVAAGRLP